MKKRQFTTILLIWFLSQQLFVAASAMHHTKLDCIGHNQTDCVTQLIETKGPIAMHTMDTSAVASVHDMSSMNCDACSIVCQPSLILSNLLPIIKPVHLSFQIYSTSLSIDILSSSLYRPPILV